VIGSYTTVVWPIIVNKHPTFISAEDLTGALKAYAGSVDHVYYIAAALSVVCVAFSFGMGWKDIRKKQPSGEKV
jgi:hypothetical protein